MRTLLRLVDSRVYLRICLLANTQPGRGRWTTRSSPWTPSPSSSALGTRALDGLTLTISRGIIYGLLGPNGAGKTTLIRILTTLLRPDTGTVRVAGHDVVRDPAAVRERIGLAGQFAAVDDHLTGRENVTMIGRLYGLSRREAVARAARIVDHIHLADAADRQLKTYSGGMRRRIDLAASLIGRPQVLFLDEPTGGGDPASRQDLWQLVRGLAAEGTTVLLTTQYLDEADHLADRIAVIDHGHLLAEGTTAELKDRIGGAVVEIEVPAVLNDPAQTTLASLGARHDQVRDRIVLPAPDGRLTLGRALRLLDQAGPAREPRERPGWALRVQARADGGQQDDLRHRRVSCGVDRLHSNPWQRGGGQTTTAERPRHREHDRATSARSPIDHSERSAQLPRVV
ncbi:MAG TPA: ATP-binding cassette domain-containing protein [Kribbellaceae bacterium]